MKVSTWEFSVLLYPMDAASEFAARSCWRKRPRDRAGRTVSPDRQALGGCRLPRPLRDVDLRDAGVGCGGGAQAAETQLSRNYISIIDKSHIFQPPHVPHIHNVLDRKLAALDAQLRTLAALRQDLFNLRLEASTTGQEPCASRSAASSSILVRRHLAHLQRSARPPRLSGHANASVLTFHKNHQSVA